MDVHVGVVGVVNPFTPSEKPKYRVFLQGFLVAMVTCYITKMTASCLSIIDVSQGAITLLLHDKVL